MKKQDWLVILIVVIVLAPFFIPATGFFAWFEASTKAHPFIMAFFKFAILATFGEMLALRIREGVYNKKGFGIVPRMMVWGFLGMCIAMAMIIFKSGVPAFLGVIGGCSCPAEVFAASELTWGKVGVAFAVSVLMNTIFAPVMMTFHKCTDIRAVERRLQEDHPPLLVPRTHHHLHPAPHLPGALCRPAGCCPRSHLSFGRR